MQDLLNNHSKTFHVNFIPILISYRTRTGKVPKNENRGWGDAYLLRALTAFPGDPVSVPSTQLLPTVQSSALGESHVFLWYPKAPLTHTEQLHTGKTPKQKYKKLRPTKKEKPLKPKYLPSGALYYIHTGWVAEYSHPWGKTVC